MRKNLWIVQICHGYQAPFLDCARQYTVLFEDSDFRVLTIYLTGEPDREVVRQTGGDEVIFLGYQSKQLRGLKLSIIRRIRHLIDGKTVHFCIAHRFKAIFLALWSTSVPVLGVCHAFGVFRRRSRRFLAMFFSRRLTLLGVSHSVAVDLRGDLPGSNIRTLYNHIDVESTAAQQLSRVDARKALGIPGNAWVVGNVGRLHPDKDQVTLIKAFALASPDLSEESFLVIMGSGPEESNLRQLCKERGVEGRVLFLGQVPGGLRYFRAFDVFVLSSDHEPFGMVLLEAMAAGVPLICSDCGGGAEVVGDSGVLFPFQDVQMLSSAITNMTKLNDQALAYYRTAMTRRLESRFSDAAAKKRFWKMFRDLL